MVITRNHVQLKSQWGVIYSTSLNEMVYLRNLGINAITGLPRDTSPPESSHQDYIAYHKQPWLDGICVAPGIIRQVRI